MWVIEFTDEQGSYLVGLFPTRGQAERYAARYVENQKEQPTTITWRVLIVHIEE